MGAHGAYLLNTFTFNLESGQQITLQDIFDPNTDYLTALSKMALQKLREQPDSYDEYMASVGVTPKEENFAAFAPEPEGLRLFFSPYQVAPWAYGMPEVLIKWDELQNVLRAQYQMCIRDRDFHHILLLADISLHAGVAAPKAVLVP